MRDHRTTRRYPVEATRAILEPIVEPILEPIASSRHAERNAERDARRRDAMRRPSGPRPARVSILTPLDP